MSTLQHSFTPVRRRHDTVGSIQLDNGSFRNWTAARCHRLLRPIRSRVELLRKGRDHKSSAPNTECAQEHFSQQAFGSLLGKEQETLSREDSDHDSDWEPVRKRVRRTYSGRYRHGAEKTMQRTKPVAIGSIYGHAASTRRAQIQPGEVIVATPLLSRARDTSYSSTSAPSECSDPKRERARRPQARYLTKDGDAHHELSETLRYLRKITDPTTFALYDGIYNALETLLKATNLKTPILPGSASSSPRKQPARRPLFLMCLRQVHVHITDQELRMAQYAKQEAIPNSEIPDICSEIYSELETLGISADGWQHLRPIVRAHGVQFICNAITNCLIEPRFANALIKLCIHTKSLDEAESLLVSLINKSYYKAPATIHDRYTEHSSLTPLATLEEYVKYTGRMAFYHEQVENLLATGRLPVTWLVTTNLNSVWTSLFKAITKVNISRQGVNLLKTILRLYSTRIHGFGVDGTVEALSGLLGTAFTSVLKVVLSIQLLNESRQHIESTATPQVYSICTQILVELMMDCRTTYSSPAELDGTTCNTESLLVISALLSMPDSETTERFRSDAPFMGRAKSVLLESLASCKGKTVAHIAAYLSAVAKCCGKGAATDGLKNLKTCVSRLERFSSWLNSEEQLRVRHAMVEAAYTFAHQSSDRAHLDYADTLSTQLYGPNPQRGEALSACSTAVDADFRWEEGIGEWVTSTPAVKTKLDPKLSMHVVSDGYDSNSPISLLMYQSTSLGLVTSNPLNRIGGRPLTSGRLSDIIPDTPTAKPANKSQDNCSRAFGNVCEDGRVQGPWIKSPSPLQHIEKCNQCMDDSAIFLDDDELGNVAVLAANDSAVLIDDDSDDELNAPTPSDIQRKKTQPRLRAYSHLKQPALEPARSIARAPVKHSKITITSLVDDSEDELCY